MIKRGDKQALVLGEGLRGVEGFGRVGVVAEDERAVSPKPVSAQVGQRLRGPAAHQVEVLVHRGQAFGVQRL